MALSSSQRAILAALVATRWQVRRPGDGGGEGYDPTAAGRSRTNGIGFGAEAFPIPPASKKNKYWRGKPKPIPNTRSNGHLSPTNANLKV